MRAYILFFFVLMLIVAVLPGCSGPWQKSMGEFASLAVDVKSADIVLQSDRLKETVMAADFSEEERLEIQAYFEDYKVARDMFKALNDSPEQILMSMHIVEEIYTIARGAYTGTQELVDEHWEEYTDAQKGRLIMWRDKVSRINDKYHSATDAYELALNENPRARAARDMLRFAGHIALAYIEKEEE